ncbi:hypothetical protein Gotur_018195 [Gossypium turneri]
MQHVYYHSKGHASTFGEFLGLILEMIYGGRIEMAWIRKYFVGMDEDSTEVDRERHTLAYILFGLGVHRVGDIVPRDVSGDVTRKNQNWWLPFLTTIMGAVPVSIFTSSSELPAYIPTQVIPEEFFVNPNAWHVKVLLVVYAIVDMHETDRVLRIHGKPYLYMEEVRHQHPHTTTQELALTTATPMPTPPPVQYVPSYSAGSSFQPLIPRPDDARWQPRMQGSQLTEGEEKELLRSQPQ